MRSGIGWRTVLRSVQVLIAAAIAAAFAGSTQAPARSRPEALRSYDLLCLLREPKRVGAGLNPQDIYRIDDRGRHWKRVTRTSLNEVDATASPDGRWIAFTRHYGRGRRQGPWIFVMRADGSGLRRLRRGFAAAWSHDGTKLAYYRAKWIHVAPGVGVWDQNKEFGIAVMTRDGTSVRVLTPGPRDLDPKWSPDGRRILVTHAVSEMWDRLAFWLFDVRHGTRRVVARREPSSGVAWSPDGRQILFDRWSWRQKLRKPGLFLMNVDSLERRELLATPDYLEYAWSPRGPIGVHLSSDEFLVLNREGSHRRKVATVSNDLISWSPNGEEILFAGMVMNKDGSDQRTITTPRGLVGGCAGWLNTRR